MYIYIYTYRQGIPWRHLSYFNTCLKHWVGVEGGGVAIETLSWSGRHGAPPGKWRAGVGGDVFCFNVKKYIVLYSVLCTSWGWERGKTTFFFILLYLISDISNYKKRAAIGSQTQVLPTGAATKPQTASQLCSCEFDMILPHPFSIVTTASQLFSNYFSSSQSLQLFSTVLKVVPSFSPPLAQLLSPLPCSSRLSHGGLQASVGF